MIGLRSAGPISQPENTMMCKVLQASRVFVACVLLSGCTIAQAVVDGDIPPYYRLEFLDKDREVWLYFDEGKNWPKMEGNLKSAEFIVEPGIHIVIIGEGTIRYGKTRISVTSDDVIINDLEMGEHTSAVVDPDGTVYLGAFIRTFQ